MLSKLKVLEVNVIFKSIASKIKVMPSIGAIIATAISKLKAIPDIMFRETFFRSQRSHLFMYLAQGLRNGATTKNLLESMAIEYVDSSGGKRTKIRTISELVNKKMSLILVDTIKNISEFGQSDAEAMFNSGLITRQEYIAAENIAAAEPYRAIEFINEKSTSQNNLKYAVLMLFFPSILVLFGYFLFQPELKAMTMSMLEPVNSISTAQIPIPSYLENRYTFGFFLAAVITLMVSFFIFINFLKQNHPKILFKLFKMTEREFVINSFEVMLGLMKAGQSPIQAISAIASGADDPATKVIFREAEHSFINGERKLYEIFKDYGMDSSTVSYLRGGESQNYLEEAVVMALEYNKIAYEKTTKRLTKILPLIGEIAMTVILLKPLLDVLMVTTTGALDFQV